MANLPYRRELDNSKFTPQFPNRLNASSPHTSLSSPALTVRNFTSSVGPSATHICYYSQITWRKPSSDVSSAIQAICSSISSRSWGTASTYSFVGLLCSLCTEDGGRKFKRNLDNTGHGHSVQKPQTWLTSRKNHCEISDSYFGLHVGVYVCVWLG
jgi:hypothetical protein